MSYESKVMNSFILFDPGRQLRPTTKADKRATVIMNQKRWIAAFVILKGSE